MDDEPKKDLEILWTPQQVADYFILNVQTIYGWIRDGKISKEKMVHVGGRARIPRSEVVRIANDKQKKVHVAPVKKVVTPPVAKPRKEGVPVVANQPKIVGAPTKAATPIK